MVAVTLLMNASDGKKRAPLLLVGLLSAILLMTGSFVDAGTTKKHHKHADGDGGGVIQDAVTPERISKFIELATSYIVRVSHTSEQDPDNEGKFTYIAYLKDDLPLDFTEHKQKEYNLLRHNGAIYSLALSYGRHPDPEVLSAIQRSVGYLKREAIGPVPDVSREAVDDDKSTKDLPKIPGLLAAWETKAMTGDPDTVKGKLGGAGLALIALVSLEQITPGTSDITYLRQLGEFIKYMQHDDGSFTCRYIPAEGGKDDSWTSLYYPGEAALGMIYLALLETDETYRQRWINVATKALMYLEELRRTQDLEEIEPDHWALLATKSLLPLLDENSKEYWRVYDHGIRVIKSMMWGHTKDEIAHVLKGCFTRDDRTCPTATRMEGMIAGLSFVRDYEMFTSDVQEGAEKLLDRMQHDIKAGISFLLSSQEVDDTHNMHGGVPVKFPYEEPRDTEVRVDYVQHSMSAMIAYEKLMHSSSGKSGLRLKVNEILVSTGDQSMFLFWPVALVLVIAIVVAVLTRKQKKKGDKHRQ